MPGITHFTWTLVFALAGWSTGLLQPQDCLADDETALLQLSNTLASSRDGGANDRQENRIEAPATDVHGKGRPHHAASHVDGNHGVILSSLAVESSQDSASRHKLADSAARYKLIDSAVRHKLGTRYSLHTFDCGIFSGSQDTTDKQANVPDYFRYFVAPDADYSFSSRVKQGCLTLPKPLTNLLSRDASVDLIVLPGCSLSLHSSPECEGSTSKALQADSDAWYKSFKLYELGWHDDDLASVSCQCPEQNGDDSTQMWAAQKDQAAGLTGAGAAQSWTSPQDSSQMWQGSAQAQQWPSEQDMGLEWSTQRDPTQPWPLQQDSAQQWLPLEGSAQQWPNQQSSKPSPPIWQQEKPSWPFLLSKSTDYSSDLSSPQAPGNHGRRQLSVLSSKVLTKSTAGHNNQDSFNCGIFGGTHKQGGLLGQSFKHNMNRGCITLPTALGKSQSLSHVEMVALPGCTLTFYDGENCKGEHFEALKAETEATWFTSLSLEDTGWEKKIAAMHCHCKEWWQTTFLGQWDVPTFEVS